MAKSFSFLAFLSLLTLGIFVPGGRGLCQDIAALMPGENDHTSLWWRDGYPTVVPDAAWRRVVKTGRYWFMLDTDTLQIPRLGSTAGPVGELPGADLRLAMTVDGKTYRCRKSGEVSRFTGPRLIESGRFLQRADVTHLIFTAKDGTNLNVEARLETAAWADQLGLTLAARPGVREIEVGTGSFGRVRGGYGLDGSNRLEIPAEECETATDRFTLEFWVLLPVDFQANSETPWLVCKNHHEADEGNYGILLHRDAVPELLINIGGGGANSHRFKVEPRHALRFNQWNHLAISYDGDSLRFYSNGQSAGEKSIGKKRVAKPGGLTFSGRGDKLGGYRFRGVIDEIRLYDRVLDLNELRQNHNRPEQVSTKPLRAWTFREDMVMSSTWIGEKWTTATLEMECWRNGVLECGAKQVITPSKTPDPGSAPDWQQVSLLLDPLTLKPIPEPAGISVKATEWATGESRPVVYDPAIGWHRINLDQIQPIPPAGTAAPSNDAIERIRLHFANPGAAEASVRLMFEKTAQGIAQKIGTPITGISAVLRDSAGNPTGIPVQLSKNWHVHAEGGHHSGQWFHGISQVRLPPGSNLDLELTIAYGHWGGVAAASHAQLSLIGWGANQRWDQCALGAWGESICYEPEQIQARCTITDVRPLMVTSMGTNPQWGWTNNVGGGDFFRLFDREKKRIPHTMMQADYHRQGPCLTEVTYSGGIGKTGLNHRETVSISRTDDLLCATYQIRMDVTQPVDFSRFAIFQTGADTYATTRERKLAAGDATGLIKEWNAQWGGDTYRHTPIECAGRLPWVSLHESEGNPDDPDQRGAGANRGIVIRNWQARLGGKDARPWIAERGLDVHARKQSSTIDIVPPPGVVRLEPGDFVEATIEHLVVPQFAKDYYGPNQALQAALAKDANTWRMIHRQAVGDDLSVTATVGTVERLHPDIRIVTRADRATFTMKGGLGYVPVTFQGLSSHRGYVVMIDGKALDQSVHGNDYWQTDYDSRARTWSQTYNLPVKDDAVHAIDFKKQ